MKLTGSTVVGMTVGFVVALAAGLYVENASLTCNAQKQSDESKVIQTSPALPPPPPEDFAVAERLSKVFNYVSKNVSASVVHITAEKRVKMGEGDDDSTPNDDFLRRFFPDERFFRFGPQRPQPQMGLGSGVIIDSDGLIVTNNHVVEGADKIKIVLPDGREVTPEWIHTDPPSDLALVKVKEKGLPALSLADSNKVAVGDMVMAVGNPFGLDQTVTQGIVSYIGRGMRISSSINYSNYIQTDAAINPGNSGGPLVNLKGQIIGINSAIISRTASYAGIGFAIPSNTVKFVVDQLKKSETVVRSYLGVQIDELTVPLAKNFGLESTEGALIPEVYENTPAGKAGMKSGDIILEFDGVKVTDRQQLQNMVAQTPPGREVKMKVWRDKKTITLTVKLEKMPQKFLAGKFLKQYRGEGGEAATEPVEIKELGLSVQNMNRDLAEKYEYSPKVKGAVVVQVDPNGEGAQLGFAEGDLFLQVQNKAVHSVEELMAVLKKVSFKDGVIVLVRSVSGGSRYVYIKID
jgi:serine protease Do